MNNQSPIPKEKLDEIQNKVRELIGTDHEFIIVMFPARCETGVSSTLTTVSTEETIYCLKTSISQLDGSSARPSLLPPNSN